MGILSYFFPKAVPVAAPVPDVPAVPGAPYEFTPTKYFFSQDFKTEYLIGMHYTVRPQNHKLHAAVQEWLHNGRVQRVVHAKPHQAQRAKIDAVGGVR